jgi:hypothetical protein
MLLLFPPPGRLVKDGQHQIIEVLRMAVDREGQNDLQAHVKSYSSFSWMMKWGTILSAITAFIVVLIISS